MIYVTDTHSFVWFLTSSDNLPKPAYKIFKGAENGENIIVVPTIVLAELLHLCAKKKYSLRFDDVLQQIREGINYTTYNLDLDTIIKAGKLESIRDIHDKIIVASALLLNAPLITSDRNIINSELVDMA